MLNKCLLGLVCFYTYQNVSWCCQTVIALRLGRIYDDALTVMPQQHCQIVLCLGADIHENSWSVGCAEAECHILSGQIHFLWHELMGLEL